MPFIRSCIELSVLSRQIFRIGQTLSLNRSLGNFKSNVNLGRFYPMKRSENATAFIISPEVKEKKQKQRTDEKLIGN